MKVENKT